MKFCILVIRINAIIETEINGVKKNKKNAKYKKSIN